MAHGLPEDSLQCSLVNFIVKGHRERLSSAGQKQPADFDMATFLVNFSETEFREDSDEVLRKGS